MQKGSTQDYNNLYDAILSLQSREECAAFFEDLFTISEISAAVQRLKVAGMLYEKDRKSTRLNSSHRMIPHRSRMPSSA